MTDKTTSQTQQKAGATEAKSAADQNVARFEAWLEDMAKVEEKSFEAAQKAIEESSKLMKETFIYGAKLRAEWRNLAIQSTKRYAEMMTATWGS